MTVYVVDDFEFFKEGSRSARLKLWQQTLTSDGVELRMRAGTIGFKKVFKNGDDPEFKKIKEFIEIEGFVRVVESVKDDSFFE